MPRLTSLAERELDPHGVVGHGNRWYAAGHCHLRRGLRVFRVDRIAEARLLETTSDKIR